MTTITDKIGLQWERFYPFIIGCIFAMAGIRVMPKFLDVARAQHWAPENLYVAVFTLGAVIAGFGVTLYTFLLTTENGFIGKSKRSVYYRGMVHFILVATLLSAISAFVSIFGMVVKEPEGVYPILWFGLTGWSGNYILCKPRQPEVG